MQNPNNYDDTYSNLDDYASYDTPSDAEHTYYEDEEAFYAYEDATYEDMNGYSAVYLNDDLLDEPELVYYPAEGRTLDNRPRWTWRRFAYLVIALLIIVALVLYLVLPLFNIFSSSAPPPPPVEPAWLA